MKINLRGRSEPVIGNDPLRELMKQPPIEPEKTDYRSPETDQDAADNLIAAHRRIKTELEQYKQRTSDALVELRARSVTIQQLEAELAGARNREDAANHKANQALQDSAKLEQLFQTISAALHSFLYPAEIMREKRAESELNPVFDVNHLHTITGALSAPRDLSAIGSTTIVKDSDEAKRLPDQKGSGDQISR